MYKHAFSFYSKFLHTCNGHCKKYNRQADLLLIAQQMKTSFCYFVEIHVLFFFSLAKRYVND